MEKIDRTCAMRYCVNCNCDSVRPFDWWEDGPTHWQVILYCGNCEVYHQGRYHNDEVEDFDVWLDDCLDEMKELEKQLTRENMRPEIENFIMQLRHDIILPEDF